MSATSLEWEPVAETAAGRWAGGGAEDAEEGPQGQRAPSPANTRGSRTFLITTPGGKCVSHSDLTRTH